MVILLFLLAESEICGHEQFNLLKWVSKPLKFASNISKTFSTYFGTIAYILSKLLFPGKLKSTPTRWHIWWIMTGFLFSLKNDPSSNGSPVFVCIECDGWWEPDVPFSHVWPQCTFQKLSRRWRQITYGICFASIPKYFTYLLVVESEYLKKLEISPLYVRSSCKKLSC